MDLEARPPRQRTGNTFRRAPLRSCKGEGAFGGESLLRLASASAAACSALGLPTDASVAHSLRKRGLWRLCAALHQDAEACGCAVRMEAVCEAPRLLKGPRIAGFKTLQRSVQLSGPAEACSDEEELLLQVVQPPPQDQLRRRIRCGFGGRRRKTRRHAPLDTDAWEAEESDSDAASDCESPPRPSEPTLADFLAPKATAPVKKRKRLSNRGFTLFRLPSRPSPTFEPTELPSPDSEAPSEAVVERSLNLEDPVLLHSTRVFACTAQIAPESLRRRFGACLWEAAAAPRRFAVDVSAPVVRAAGKAGPHGDQQGLAFLTFEVARSGERRTELEVRANVLLQPERTEIRVPPLERPADDFQDFSDLVEAFADAVGRMYGDSLSEASPDGQLLLLATRWREPLTRGAPEVRPQTAAVHKRSVWRRMSVSNSAVDGWEAQECGICFDAVGASGCCLRCGHGFCEGCWQRHLIAQVRHGRLSLRCAAHACEEPVDLATALRFVSLAVLEQHRRLVLSAALEEGGSTAFCPNAQCRRPLRLRNSGGDDVDASRTVRCVCGAVFCFACGAEGHWPAACAAFEAYRAAARAMGVWRARHETAVVRVKVMGQRCPACRRFFEKSVGCNDMKCRCGIHFCYTCGISRDDHARSQRYYPCSNSSRDFPRQILRQKTRFTSERPQPTQGALARCPAAFRCALQLRQRRFDLLGSGFQFRRRFGAALARLEGARSRYRLHAWRALFCGLEDVLRAAEFALVARGGAELSSTARRRFEDRGEHLRRIQEEILQQLERGVTSATELRALLQEGATALRAIHCAVD